MSKLDYSKIFIKEACPTSIGGQAIMEGVMMQGPDRVAIAMRLPSGELYLKTKEKPKQSRWMKIPLLRGIFSFVASLILGMGTLMESADILEAYAPEDYSEEPGKFETWLNERFGKKAAWDFLMTMSVVLAFAITIVFFVILPTWVVNFLGKWISSTVLLNLIEGILRIVMFVAYVVAIRRMEEIKNLFRYHGAEHKSIHCYENGLELTPENADKYYTLHPRCGTSFLVFVLLVSLLLFSFLGWPNLLWRIASRILLIPVIAGISYELLKWAGRSDGKLVRILSYPGLMLQKLTTAEPTKAQLEVALLALKAVLVDADTPYIEGFVDANGKLVNQFDETLFIDMEAEEPTVPNFEYEPPKIDVPDAISNRKAIEWGQEKLADCPNGRNEALTIFTYVTGLTRSRMITQADAPMAAGLFSEYKRKINERKSGRPLQYIVGTQDFMGLQFRVNPDVLIPRMDTEVLVERIISIAGNKIDKGSWNNAQLLDLCTGSGCIGISLAHRFPNVTVTLTDVSEKALATASENARINGVFTRCEFLLGNMFRAVQSGRKFSIITSNPPYIESNVIETLDTEVKDYEPRMALDGGKDGLDYYRVIAVDADRYLEDGGLLALEIGCDQAASVKALLQNTGRYQKIVTFDDYAGLNRVVIAQKY